MATDELAAVYAARFGFRHVARGRQDVSNRCARIPRSQLGGMGSEQRHLELGPIFTTGIDFRLGRYSGQTGRSRQPRARRAAVRLQHGPIRATKWAYDSVNKLYYPTQSIFLGSDGPAQIYVVLDVQKTDPLSAPVFPPKAVIYEQTAKYTGVAWGNAKYITFAGPGFKEFTGVAH